MAEGVLILEPGDERAKKIGKAMANKSATAILSVLKGNDLTLSEISERMDQPMTTVKYHVENLLDAELIEVRKVRYSEKGREVKIYGVNDRLVIVAPSGGNVKDTLLKYASVFALLLIATLAMVAISPSFDFFASQPQQAMTMQDWGTGSSSTEIMGAGIDDARNAYSKGENQTFKAFATEVTAEDGYSDNLTYAVAYAGEEGITYDVVPAATQAPLPPETGADGIVHLFIIAFFLGGCLILATMMIYEIIVWRKEKEFWKNVGKEDK